MIWVVVTCLSLKPHTIQKKSSKPLLFAHSVINGKKDGTGEHGILYCQMIDPSIAKGYNRNFDVLHDRYVLKEGDCHFRFQMKEDESN